MAQRPLDEVGQCSPAPRNVLYIGYIYGTPLFSSACVFTLYIAQNIIFPRRHMSNKTWVEPQTPYIMHLLGIPLFDEPVLSSAQLCFLIFLEI